MNKALPCALVLAVALLCGSPARANETDTLRTLMYVGQAVDCVNSGIAQDHGAVEVNPLMKPWAHGGVPTMCFGMALSDIVVGTVTRRWSSEAKRLTYAVQIGSNAWGISFTLRHTGL